MAQFDLFRHARNKRYPFLLDVQADLLRDLATHIVVPLTPLKRLAGKPISRLNAVVSVEGAVVITDTDRPQLTDALEVERRMTRLRLEESIFLSANSRTSAGNA